MEGKRFGERLKWLNTKVGNIMEIIKEGIMKLSKSKMLESFNKFKNDVEDYGTEEDIENLEDISTPLTESEGDIISTLKEISKKSPRHKNIIKEFLNYLNNI
jgi:hypothetical protein